MSKLWKFYNRNYKKLIFIPVIILLISIILIFIQYSNTGDFFNKDVSLKGGISSSVYTDKQVEINKIKEELGVDNTVRRLADFSTGKQIGYLIKVSDLEEDVLKEKLEKLFGMELTSENFSIEKTGETLGKAFYRQLIIALIFAFLFMAAVVFITFRTLVPSLAVIQAAFSDIVITLAIINVIGLKISSAGIVAFLLVLGYSIDTDILLTTKILKRKGGSLFEKVKSSIRTGLTMTLTTMAALTVAYFLTQSFVLKGMFLIILIALFIDILATYFTNLGILMWYYKKKIGDENE